MLETLGAAVPMIAASVRASVERGDPLSIFGVDSATAARNLHRALNVSGYSARAHEPKPDAPEPVASDPEILDTEADGFYRRGVQSHPSHSDLRPAQPHDGGEISGASWSETDRLAFLARVQRIDPRERRA